MYLSFDETFASGYGANALRIAGRDPPATSATRSPSAWKYLLKTAFETVTGPSPRPFFFESVKATSDLYSGVSGEVTAVNEKLGNEPGVVNRDPYEAGWMIKVKVTGAADATKLLSTDEYLKKTGH